MPRTIRIAQYQFQLSEPFQPGHLLSLEEASALNALRAENIRNLLSSKVRTAAAAIGGGKLLPEATLSALRAEAARLDADYTFGKRKTAGSGPGTLEREAKAIAKATVVARYPEASPSEQTKLVEELSQHPQIQAEARARLEEQGKLATKALAELL